VTNAGKFGLIGDLASLDEVVQSDGECHHLCNAGQAAGCGLLGLRSGFDDSLGRSLAGLEIKLVGCR
jgi:hypothetical protein